MAYSGVQMFMDKLNQLINCNHIPSINNPEIIRERPQFQLLYEELDNPVIQTLFIHQHQDLEKVNDLKKRFTDAAEEAQYIVDLFLSRVLDKNNGYFTTSEDYGRRSLKSVVNLFLPCVHIKKNDVSSPTSDDFNPSLNLDGVMRSFNLVKVELTSINIGSIKTDPSPRPERMLNQSADPIPFTTKPQGSNIVMGLDDDAGLIRDKLVEDQKKVDVVSIVGVLAKEARIMELRDGLDKFQKCFPYIKELKCNTYKDEDYDFKSLIYLEKLEVFSRRRRMQWTVHDVPKGCGKNQITFPATLKALTLVESCLPWSGMSSIQSLPNLEVLILMDDAFKGNCWNTEGQEFPQLKLLRLWGLDIKQWETYSTSFPCLRELEIIWCYHLEEIPLEIGDIPTLELIKILNCRHSVSVSVRRIQEEQNDSGNNLKIDISELP
ncbi:hypothetical protein L1987_38219 [Smallanthus sonchifolius]|uniref:Uncharacterized protein n=1 Tax=Smallanthus sonchifolius TaxID=185202 RepID=A0ACB9HI22_9ASTR|nr:hypothetical protein L1987_38219 [Smallanthus sonchifolius]